MKKGDWILVRDLEAYQWYKRIFLADIGGATPYVCVTAPDAEKFQQGKAYNVNTWKYAKEIEKPEIDKDFLLWLVNLSEDFSFPVLDHEIVCNIGTDSYAIDIRKEDITNKLIYKVLLQEAIEGWNIKNIGVGAIIIFTDTVRIYHKEYAVRKWSYTVTADEVKEKVLTFLYNKELKKDKKYQE